MMFLNTLVLAPRLHIYIHIYMCVCMYILIAWCDTDTNFIKCREDYSVCQEYMYRCSYLEYLLKAEITLFQFANHLALAYHFKIPAWYTSSTGLYESSGAYKQVQKYFLVIASLAFSENIWHELTANPMECIRYMNELRGLLLKTFAII